VKKHSLAIAIALSLLVTAVAPVLYWQYKVDLIRCGYDQECANPPPTTSSEPNWKKAVPSMKGESALVLNWTLLLVTGIVAIIVTKKTHRFRSIRFIYFVFAPALGSLLGSLMSAVAFQQRLAFVQFQNCASQAGSLNDLLLVQISAFKGSIWLLALVCLVCLGEITAGFIEPGVSKEDD
jgi:hypothetical protein